MRAFWRCFLAICLLSALPARAESPEPNGLIAATEEWPPFQLTDTNGAAAGMNVDMVRAILVQAGLSAQIKVYPWARTLFLGEHRPNTLIFSLSRSKERENGFLWIGELMRRNDWFYRATGHDSVSPGSLDEVKSCCAVCVERKDIVEDDLQRLGFQPGRQYITAESFADCMRLVQKGALPLLVNSPQGLSWAMKQHHDVQAGFQAVIPLPSAAQEPLYLAASIGTPPATVARLRAAFQTLQLNGTLEQIRRQFSERTKP
ncbi:MAG: transporter substrate-binding domain-containing protein [Paludibacterium sp.]|uniref:substrate-binding periplasmic protein n=1 Tax=Paludibacterium sp. TaxID=1917523 RepID=UPI0025DB5F6D|nr:transporter substrate-binding domain-containing protein [Paludibacterium sp.]MBV8046856.1 transporter substrate-binding domain-containing protein [Paludibacterium sp.]MBV8647645.1 transporter substrate-binding domain-containing protein [Paludibacterium sp.]